MLRLERAVALFEGLQEWGREARNQYALLTDLN